MRARTKITIWTSSFTLVVAISFSVFVLYEIAEQPLRLIDREIRDISDYVVRHISARKSPVQGAETLSQKPFDRYYIKVVDTENRIHLITSMASQTDLPVSEDDKFYFTKKRIGLEHLTIAPDDKKELEEAGYTESPFRVYRKTVTISGQDYTLLIGLPIPVLELEMRELITELVIWLAASTILVIIASYYLSGGILKPLSRINTMIREISEVSLDKRLPIGNNRDELHTLAESLNNMFDRLRFSFDRQKEYIGNASHELKTPLTVLMLGNEKILQEELPENVRTTLDKQLDILRRLTKMVRNLLEISRLEQHESFNPERLDLKPLVAHIIEEFEDILINRSIDIHPVLDSSIIHGDREKILQMLINLLDNAIKYNLPGNGQIWISVKPVRDVVELSISNTGKTIPEESLEKIFEQFYRVEKSRALKFGGAGLGLAIVKQIVNLHHGSIVATNKATGINQFLVRFPAGDD